MSGILAKCAPVERLILSDAIKRYIHLRAEVLVGELTAIATRLDGTKKESK